MSQEVGIQGRSGSLVRPMDRWHTAALVLSCLLIATSTYRAVTQSVTYDEAVTYIWFLTGPIHTVFTYYNANNHVFFTLLAKLSIGVFGLSPLSLRLPSVLAGALYVWALWPLCRMSGLRGAAALVATGALALNPLVLDFFAAARGYGPGLAFLAVALCAAGRLLTTGGEGTPRRYLVVSLPLAWSVSANLTFLFPGVALAVMVVVLAICWRHPRRSIAREVKQLAAWFCLPGVLMTVALLSVPLSIADRGTFWYGAEGVWEAISSLTEASLRHNPNGWTDSWVVALLASWAPFGVIAGVLLLLSTALVLLARAAGGHGAEMTAAERFLLLVSGTLSLTLLLLITAHHLAALAYPLERTGLYLIFLFTLALGALVGVLNARPGWRRTVGLGGVALFAALSLHYAAELQVSHFRTWRYDAGTKEIFHIVRQYVRADGLPLRVTTGRWTHDPALNFYRALYPQDNVAEVPEDWEPGHWDFDFFVLQPGPEAEATLEVATLLFRHPISGAVLLKNTRGGLIQRAD